MPQKNMPKDWQPPYPAWSAEFPPEDTQITAVYIGVQTRQGDAAEFHGRLRAAAQVADGPRHLERASYLDSAGFRNDVYMAYWTDRARYRAWCASSRFAEWWAEPARLSGPEGYWWEEFNVPMDYLETSFSSEHSAGMAAMASKFCGPIREHAYWGAMRDRVPASAFSTLGDGGTLTPLAGVDSAGRRLTVVPPENLCIIRSAQNWTHCTGEEREIYLNEVQPVLVQGMNFLRNNPVETGCVFCRYMDEVTLDNEPQEKTFGLACFLTLAHLEAWARSHPTHLAIFQQFHKLAQRLSFDVTLRLWHEVVALPAGSGRFEYLNCHPGTGLLPYFPAQ